MSGNHYFDAITELKWCEKAGIGYLPLKEMPYDQAYFDKYVVMDDSKTGEALTSARVDLVKKYTDPMFVTDIGIGAGRFMREANCAGFDINPIAVKMLIEEQRFIDPYSNNVLHATFWDSLEHIAYIDGLLDNVREYIFVSLPIFDDVKHVLQSKHYRPTEHCWYFTRKGFERFIAAHGFTVLEYNTMETDIGREGIGTFVCKRVN